MSEHSIPRRTFLGTVAASTAGAALGVAARPGLLSAADTVMGAKSDHTVPAMPIKLGVASYSLREFPLDKTLEMIKTLRTPYVNFKSVHMPYEKTPAELDALRKSIEAQGFTIVGGGTITFEMDTDADVEKYFIYAKAAGMPTMVSTCTPSILPRVEKFAKQSDIKVAIHNHGTEDKNYPSPYARDFTTCM